MLIHDTPDSTNIARLRYDVDNSTLFIEFRSGKTYRYNDFPSDLYNAFASAPSAGKFFNEKVRQNYKGVEV